MHKKNSTYLQIIRFVIQILFFSGLIFPIIPHPDVIGNFIFFSPIIVGVFFCGWICPFGAIQDFLSILSKKLRIKQIEPSEKLQKYIQFFRYFFALISFYGITFSFLNARYYFNHNLINNMLTFSSAFTLFFFFISSFFIQRPFCNYFCIKGALDGLMSVFRPITIKRNDKKCIHCHLCNKNCPMKIKVEKYKLIQHPNCINCMNCIISCPVKCIKYGFIKEFKNK